MIMSPLPRPRTRAARRVSMGSFLVVLTLGITACQPAITILQPSVTTSPLPIATVAPADHALSIIDVEFDPPLESADLLNNSGVSLLVAISNDGTETESGVQVSAQLLDATGRKGAVDLLRETAKIKSLEAGGVEIVRFSQVTDLPVLSNYQLIVKVAPAPGETDLEDNTLTYEILVGADR